jgi:hypothetical protein
MGTTSLPRLGIALALFAACLAVAAPAGARSVSVSGTQEIVDEDAGIFKMHGDLVGDWRITAFKEVPSEGLFQGKGRELFDGCLDKDHNDSCGTGDPSGKLRLVFRFWAFIDDSGTEQGGACWHPIVRGTGAFRHARGVIQMLDTPTGPGGALETRYVGKIRMRGHHSASASRSGCG